MEERQKGALENLTIIRVWHGGGSSSFGHVSLQTLNAYMSLWPVTADKSPSLFSLENPYFNSYEEDLRDEDKTEDYKEVLYGLDTNKMERCFFEHRRAVRHWTLLGEKNPRADAWAHSCVTFAKMILEEGGIFNLMFRPESAIRQETVRRRTGFLWLETKYETREIETDKRETLSYFQAYEEHVKITEEAQADWDSKYKEIVDTYNEHYSSDSEDSCTCDKCSAYSWWLIPSRPSIEMADPKNGSHLLKSVLYYSPADIEKIATFAKRNDLLAFPSMDEIVEEEIQRIFDRKREQNRRRRPREIEAEEDEDSPPLQRRHLSPNICEPKMNAVFTINSNGYAVKAYECTNSENVQIIKIEPGYVRRNHVITWNRSACIDIPRGTHPAIALNAQGRLLIVYNRGDDLYYGSALLNRSRELVEWQSFGKYGEGIQPAIALNEEGEIVEVHRSENYPVIYTRVGHLAANGSVNWGTRWRCDKQAEDAQNPSVAVQGKKVVITWENHIWKSQPTYCQVGNISGNSLALSQKFSVEDCMFRPRASFLANNQFMIAGRQSGTENLSYRQMQMNAQTTGFTFLNSWAVYGRGNKPSGTFYRNRFFELHEEGAEENPQYGELRHTTIALDQ